MSNPSSVKVNELGVEFIKRMMIGINITLNKGMNDFQVFDQKDLSALGTNMAILYRLSTCQDKCRGGDHILESLAGRTYNLAESSFILLLRGYYDESKNLIRSIGEISNLLSLFCISPEEYVDWCNSNKKERLKNFAPARVRQKIVKLSGGELQPLFSETLYSELCETYVHPTPFTKPNLYNDEDLKIIGGKFQKKGALETMELLVYATYTIALQTSKMIGSEDLFEILSRSSYLQK